MNAKKGTSESKSTRSMGLMSGSAGQSEATPLEAVPTTAGEHHEPELNDDVTGEGDEGGNSSARLTGKREVRVNIRGPSPAGKLK